MLLNAKQKFLIHFVFQWINIYPSIHLSEVPSDQSGRVLCLKALSMNQGTRSKTGKLRDFKAGAFEIALATKR
jgi:hypothetical protein